MVNTFFHLLDFNLETLAQLLRYEGLEVRGAQGLVVFLQDVAQRCLPGCITGPQHFCGAKLLPKTSDF